MFHIPLALDLILSSEIFQMFLPHIKRELLLIYRNYMVCPLTGHSEVKLIRLGDVIHLRIFTRDLIILSSFEGAQELLEKRSAIYSSRPRFVLCSDM